MLDHVFRGSKKYWAFIGLLLAVIGAGVFAYSFQLRDGLTVTGMSRDVSWGFYIAQFTFMVGVAAAAVMVVIPYYLHDYKAFGKMVIMAEFLAVPAVLVCMLFIAADMGQPMRMLNVMLHPTPNSVMFFDMTVLFGYLGINLIVGCISLDCERKGVHYPGWLKFFIFLSVPWAVSIHTVTAFLYAGLEARPFWMTAILAPRFLASAFAAGPSLLIILSFIVRKVSRFDPGEQAIKTLSTVVTYAMCINIFFVGLEVFTVFYADMPHHMEPFIYMFKGLEHHGETYNNLVPFMWFGQILGVIAAIFLVIPSTRKNFTLLPFLCGAVILALWLEKGLGMVLAGFIPSPLLHITEYVPTAIELAVTIGIYAIGALTLTVLYKIIIGVREHGLPSAERQ
jgi:molybdopterin-containing oxidoreductase family membrane subunit